MGRQEGADGEMMRSVIGRLSVLLLDGYLDEAEANPDISGRGEKYQKHPFCFLLKIWLLRMGALITGIGGRLLEAWVYRVAVV